MPHRTERITETIKDELTELIGYELSDPRIGSATVTEVTLTPDKRHAFVSVRCGPETDPQGTLDALVHASGFLRRQLAERMTVYRIPELHFELDAGTKLGDRMDFLLRRIRKGRPRDPQTDENTPPE